MSNTGSEKVLYHVHPSMFRNHPFLFLFCVLLIAAYGAGLVILLIWWMQCRNKTLTITDQRTTLRTGILSRSLTEVWHRDVRNVQLNQSLFQRMFGTGRLAISSAGQGGMEIDISGIPGPTKAKSIIDSHRGR